MSEFLATFESEKVEKFSRTFFWHGIPNGEAFALLSAILGALLAGLIGALSGAPLSASLSFGSSLQGPFKLSGTPLLRS